MATIDKQILLIICSIGALNGLLIALYFFFVARPRKKHHIFLGGLLLALIVRILKPLLFNFFPYSFDKNIYLTIAITSSILIGPLLYQYVYHYTGKGPNKAHWKYHIGLNLLPISLICFFFPYWKHPDLWTNYLSPILLIQRITYLILTGFLIKKTSGLFSLQGEVYSKEVGRWVRIIFWGNVLIVGTYKLIFAGLGSFILGALLFSFFLYLLIFLLMASTNERNTIIHQPLPKYGGRVIIKDIALTTLDRLYTLLNREEIYCNPNLKMNRVAQKIGVNPHHLSQVINERLGKNFNQLINEYRINKAKELILKKHEFTLEAIGYECGFRAKSTFFATFKKITGTTPLKFKKN